MKARYRHLRDRTAAYNRKLILDAMRRWYMWHGGFFWRTVLKPSVMLERSSRGYIARAVARKPEGEFIYNGRTLFPSLRELEKWYQKRFK